MAAATVSVRFHPAASAARCGGGSRRSRRLSGVIRAQSAPASAAAAALTQDDLKRLAAVRAVEQVESGMVLGLGTGSTAAFAVAEIGALLASGKLSGIVGVPTSKRTFEQAQSLGIPLSTLDDHPRIDLAIDGADEVRLATTPSPSFLLHHHESSTVFLNPLRDKKIQFSWISSVQFHSE
jgi:ribose 5-phosphate isomerase A